MRRLDMAKGLILQGLGVSSIKSVEDRRTIQKKIYLLQELGVDLGYRYAWYISGPFSLGLATFICDKLGFLLENKDELTGWNLSEDVSKKITLINSVMAKAPSSLDGSSWCQLLASIVYVDRNAYLWDIEGSKDHDKLIEEVISRELHQYSRDHYVEAMSLLGKHKIINNVGE